MIDKSHPQHKNGAMLEPSFARAETEKERYQRITGKKWPVKKKKQPKAKKEQ